MKSSPWFDAIFEPSGLLLLAASVVAGLVAAWWLFPIGLALWAFIFLRILLDPSLRLNQEISNRTGLTQRFQIPFGRIQKVQINIFNTIIGAPGGIRRSLQPVLAAVNQLMDILYQQCNLMTPLENLRITSTPEDKLRQDLDKANAQLAAAADPAARKDLEESTQSIQTRLQQMVDISQKLDRFDAQLTELENDLQSVLAEVVKLQASDSRSRSAGVRALVDQVKQDMEQIRSN